MKIVFLDTATVDRGDIDFAELAELGDFTGHPTTSPDEVADRVADATVIITNKVVITPVVLEAAQGLKLVLAAATGVNHIDLEACERRAIGVANVAGYSTDSVAQHVFAVILELVTRVSSYASRVREDWPASPTFTRLDHPLTELAGKTLGIVGLGAIGNAVARVAGAFGMEVVALARDGASRSADIRRLPEAEFFAAADVVSLHCPLTKETRGLIDRRRLGLMKPGALLINTGRGPLLDEEAVAEALREGHLGGAGLDVLSVEPPPADHPLLADDLPNLIVTPHTAWSTIEARRRLVAGLAENLRSFLGGGRRNRIL